MTGLDDAPGSAARSGVGRSVSTWLVDGLGVDGARVDIEVVDGVVAAIEPAGTQPRRDGGVDLDGRLVIPSLVEPHAHLDKALTADRVPNPAGDLMGAIDGWIAAARAGEFTPADTEVRATQAMEALLFSGVTRIRTHVNVGRDDSIDALRALQRAAQGFDGLIDVEIVALTASPMTGVDGADNRTALLRAVEAGVDLIGGCPHLDADPVRMIDDVLAIATDAGRGLDLHVDETLEVDVLTLETLAQRVIETGFSLPVTASHCVSLGMQPPEVQSRIAAVVAEAGITVVTLPQTNLFLQGREHTHAVPRGLTAIGALVDAGVSVVGGGDNVEDPFNLLGRSDPLETAALLVMAGHLRPEAALAMVVAAPGEQTAGVDDPLTLRVGAAADLVALDATSVRGAIARAPADRMVLRGGVVVAETHLQRRTIR